jgi:hypothetical protein
MRKGLAALAAAVFFLGVGGVAQAVIGIPDDVPGSTLLYPFFKVDPTPTATSRQDSLLVITNTANVKTTVHITLWSTKSDHVLDFSVALTEHDVYSCSLLDLLINPTKIAKPCGILPAAEGVPLALKVEGQDLLAGYVTADVVTQSTGLFPGQAGYPFQDWNILIGHLYLVDLPAGSASGFNAVSIESDTTTLFPLPVGVTRLGHPAVAFNAGLPTLRPGFYLNRCIEIQGLAAACDPATAGYDNRERIDGFSGDILQTLNTLGFPPASPTNGDSPLSLIVRYFSATAINASSEIWLWKDRNISGAAAKLSVAVYDEDENRTSLTLSLPDEVNFAKTSAIISQGVPGGWIRLKFTCSAFGYCGYNPANPATWGSAAGPATPIQAVAYGLQFANSQNATLRWDAAFPAHRQYTNYIGGIVAE